MPRPPARRGRRRNGTDPPEAVAARDFKQSDEGNFAVVIPKLNHTQTPKGQDGNPEKISREGSRENSHGTAYIQRAEPVVDEEGDLGAASYQVQTPVSKHQNGTTGLPPLFDAISSAAGKPFLPGRGDTSSRVQKFGTPAFESSMLSNFRRRPRQPSILQMMHTDQSSELDDDDDLLASFNPDDESTPLKFPNRKSIPQDSVSSPPSTPQNLSPTSLRNIKLHPKVQVQVSRSSDPSERAIAPDENTDNSASEDGLLPTPRRAQSPELPELLSQTMMPPESSPVSSVEKNRSDTAYSEHPANGNSSPGTQKAAEKQLPMICKPRISTATLRENLLPQRRFLQKQRASNRTLTLDDIENENCFDDYSGAFEADRDELSYPVSRVKRRKDKTGMPEARKGTGNKKQASTDRSIQGRRQTPAIKSTNIRLSKNTHLAHSKKGDEITCFSLGSREALADKENQSSHTVSSLPLDSEERFSATDISPPASERVFLSEELMQQARKFAEISLWPLDFEDATVVSGQSSPFQ
ncbi:conserved hypothetical protein [Histoplasma capsulatum var. duboisii H88]|uniref:Prolidase, xaa-Pro aminopeptidase n=1 Tax=Ajellomyces capsulatus (strain H88) TaxID=544711 RepID=F0U4M2_AJEC8|nr:conserved hypothetical protein [Histoplasma capsulatum var. duboisii H88]QSS51605.1 prolidase, xaa-Pro aminopeptidase [Histoplasma capsulatum var. duboisii H88]